MYKILLKAIPINLVISLAWSVIKPELEKKVNESTSNIDNLILKEIDDLIRELNK